MEVCFLLIKPENPANVGATCRAMKTMGHSDLRLIEPCDYLSLRGRALAHASEDLLESAKLFDSFEEATKDCDIVVGTTARHRKIKLDYIEADDIMEIVRSKKEKVRRVCFVFGGERSGLSGEDLFACDLVTTIPTATTFPSLNLSQSVMLFSYLTRTQKALMQTKDWRIDESAPTEEHFKSIKTSLGDLIDDLGMKDSSKIKAQVLTAVAKLGSEDLNIVQGVRRRVQDRIDTLKEKIGASK
ncbi:RNA methyltransferase [bacterium]|nr:RNA methyltransferase [bacterium]